MRDQRRGKLNARVTYLSSSDNAYINRLITIQYEAVKRKHPSFRVHRCDEAFWKKIFIRRNKYTRHLSVDSVLIDRGLVVACEHSLVPLVNDESSRRQVARRINERKSYDAPFLSSRRYLEYELSGRPTWLVWTEIREIVRRVGDLTRRRGLFACHQYTFDSAKLEIKRGYRFIDHS